MPTVYKRMRGRPWTLSLLGAASASALYLVYRRHRQRTDTLDEFSVVFTSAALNHMSGAFQQVMRDLSSVLKEAYAGQHVAVVPGSGTFAMESVARALLTADTPGSLVLRTGLFSHRWTQIAEACGLAPPAVLSAAVDPDTGGYVPPCIHQVVAHIRAESPAVVFAAHVDTASGLRLPDAYIRQVGAAARASGALLVLDCVASGCHWVHMADLCVDVVVSAPQKGWSGPSCAGFVVLSDAARARVRPGGSFAGDLVAWLGIMQAYEAGGHAYHATLPTDALRGARDAMLRVRAWGWARAQAAQHALGAAARRACAAHGLQLVVRDPRYQADGVLVCLAPDPGVVARFADAARTQVAAGVPLRLGEHDLHTFRIGLFGLDKLADVSGTVRRLSRALTRVFSQ